MPVEPKKRTLFLYWNPLYFVTISSFPSSLQTKGGIKMRHYFIYLFLLLMVASGCSSAAQEINSRTVEEGSYENLLNIHGEIYYDYGYDEEEKYTVLEEVGEVEKTLEGEEIMPKEHLTANFLEVGTKIFSTKEDLEIFLVGYEGKYIVFKKKP